MAKIINRKIVKYTGKVYDLEVENSHSYNIEGLGVHNSACGCLLTWCLDITKIDPIRFGLYFERFLNPTRKSLPDLDIDYFADTDDVTDDFIIKKYGRERFLAVSTFSLFNEKGCLKDVVRAHLGEEHTGFQSDVHAVTKEMPNFDKVEYSLREWFESWPKNVACSERVKNWLTAPSNKLILEQTLKLQGQIRGIGQHAAGITITPGPSWDYLPVNIIASNKNLVTAFQEADKSGKDLSELGILKLDRLKIVALNIIKAAIDLVKEKKGIDIKDKVDYVDLEDPNLFGEVRLGINQGVFQFESAGMGALLKGMAVSSFEELVASNALYRPGPMGIGAHEEYIKNKFNPENISYIHPALEPILKDTNGVLVFQEQLMFLASKIGGMTLGEGDTLRRYMDKASSAIKKKSQGEELNIREEANYKEFESIWNKFLSGAEKNGYKVNEIDKIKDWVIKYLGYSFNRSHSVSYAYLAMQTLYLKHYYPTEFYTALLNHPKKNGDKDKVHAWISSAIAAAMSKGITILPPSRRSGWEWTMTGDKEISMGFSGINGFGDIAYEELMRLVSSKVDNFSEITMHEFFSLPFSKYNKKVFEVCVKSGMFDDWTDSREFLYYLKTKKTKKSSANQLSMFDIEDFQPEEVKMVNTSHPATTDEQRRIDFLEVCNFDLEKIKWASEIRQKISEKSKRPIENIMNFEEEDWYYFIVKSIDTMLSKAGKEYNVLKVGDGISNTTLRAFNPMTKKIAKAQVKPGDICVAKFEKNDAGFLNFKNDTDIKVLTL